MPGLEKNRIYRAHIDGYSSEGLGIARIDGQVVFVHGAVRGEICDVLVMTVLKNAAFGKIAALVEPSPARRTPDCPYYGRCGGCDFRHMSYEEELWAKRARVQDALTRIGGAEITVEDILGAEQPLHYRNKSIYPISPAGEVGFYRARSHQVVHVEHCLIQKPEADALAQAVRDYIARFRVAPYDEATGRGLLRHLYVRTSCRGESLVCLLVNGQRLPHEEELVAMLRAAAPKTCGAVLGENTRRGNAILGDRYRTLWGRDYLTDTLCGLELRLSVPSFYQVNHDQAQRLYEKALEYAGLTGRELAVDLYCGAGTITQVLARRARHVIGGEIVPEAIRDAEESARRNGVDNVEFLCGDASRLAAKSLRNALLFNVLAYMSDRLLTGGNTVAVLDELYLWLSNPVAIEYIRNCLKRVRKRDSTLVMASQNLEDFDQEGVREMTKPLFAIPPHQFLFNPGSIGKRFYMDMLQLDEAEFELIQRARRGECLYKCGMERYHLEVKAPPHKAVLFGSAGGR